MSFSKEDIIITDTLSMYIAKEKLAGKEIIKLDELQRVMPTTDLSYSLEQIEKFRYLTGATTIPNSFYITMSETQAKNLLKDYNNKYEEDGNIISTTNDFLLMFFTNLILRGINDFEEEHFIKSFGISILDENLSKKLTTIFGRNIKQNNVSEFINQLLITNTKKNDLTSKPYLKRTNISNYSFELGTSKEVIEYYNSLKKSEERKIDIICSKYVEQRVQSDLKKDMLIM